VLDVLLPVVGLHLDLERVDILHEERGLAVRAVVDEEVAPLRQVGKARDVEVAEGIALGIRDVTAATATTMPGRKRFTPKS
jgi:hypothetical protein